MKIKAIVHYHTFGFMLALAAMVFALDAVEAMGEGISVQAAVEQNEACVGEALAFQIRVDGNDSPKAPDLSGIAGNDFDVQSVGGQTTNRESVTIINGEMNREVHRGYFFSYQLTPKREGMLTIPSIEVHAGNETIKTQPIQIRVGKPEENENFKFRLGVSRDKCYVNEPVVLTVTWYISMNVRDANFTLPILSNKAFTVIDPDLQPDPQKKYAQIPLAGTVTLAEVGQGSLDGKTYSTISFQKILMPREPGTFEIPQSTVSCNAVVRLGAPNGGFFGASRELLKKFVTPSNRLNLTVLDLPAQGRPADFSGLVGSYNIEAAAIPTQVNVGDPITLTLKISGADYLKSVELPSLNRQSALIRDFKIPEEMAPGKIEGNIKVFTQTIRATRSSVKEIPPIELSYFDSADGGYKVARTKAIPLSVKETKVVTLQDAEGRETTSVGNELKASHEGIAYNYEDPSVLENQKFGLTDFVRSPFRLVIGMIPPFTYGLLLTSLVVYRRRQADPAGVKARRAYGELSKRINICLKNKRQGDSEAFGDLLEAARHYLGDKLRLSSGALTWRDVEPYLTKQGVDSETIDGLKSVFDDCEARRYTKSTGSSEDLSATAQHLLDLARKLERSLK